MSRNNLPSPTSGDPRAPRHARAKSSGADLDDLEQIASLIALYYDAFDNRPPRTVDGVLLRAAFADGATVTQRGATSIEQFTIDDFIDPRVVLLNGGALTQFHEWELRSLTQLRGNFAVRRSQYRKAGQLEGDSFTQDGVKTFTLRRDPDGWRIASIVWQDEPA